MSASEPGAPGADSVGASPTNQTTLTNTTQTAPMPMDPPLRGGLMNSLGAMNIMAGSETTIIVEGHGEYAFEAPGVDRVVRTLDALPRVHIYTFDGDPTDFVVRDGEFHVTQLSPDELADYDPPTADPPLASTTADALADSVALTDPTDL